MKRRVKKLLAYILAAFIAAVIIAGRALPKKSHNAPRHSRNGESADR